VTSKAVPNGDPATIAELTQYLDDWVDSGGIDETLARTKGEGR